VRSSGETVEQTLFPAANRAAERTFDFGKSATPLPPLRPNAQLGVLDITEWFGETSGGVRTYLMQKAAYVEQRPHLRQVLVVPGDDDVVTHSAGVRCYRLRGPQIPTQKPYRFMLATRSIRRIIESERPSVVEVGSCFSVPWISTRAARRASVPVVGFFHGNLPRTICPFPERAGALARLGYAAAWRYMRAVYAPFAVTICASEFTATDLREHGVERVARVPLGVDLDHFNVGRRAEAVATRERAGLPVDVPLAAFVGRFAREKEIDVLLRAWPEIERRTDACLVIIGDGPQRAMVDALAQRCARIYCMPYERDRGRLADLLASVDLLISPGSTETFGLSALEAMASGTPVLSADRGGVAELVSGSGAGMTFAAGDVASLSDVAIDALRRDDLHCLGLHGRAYAEREHAWSRTFDRLFAVYRDLVA
jgi:alpha-1,6-mannosyltransferase